MTSGPAFLYLLLLVPRNLLSGAQPASDPIRFASPTCPPKRVRAVLRTPAMDSGLYRRFKRRSATVEERVVVQCQGLYYLSLPSYKTKFRLLIPCLVTSTGQWANFESIEGTFNAAADSVGFARRLDAIMGALPPAFSPAETDTIRKAFRYGAYRDLKPGVSIEFR